MSDKLKTILEEKSDASTSKEKPDSKSETDTSAQPKNSTAKNSKSAKNAKNNNNQKPDFQIKSTIKDQLKKSREEKLKKITTRRFIIILMKLFFLVLGCFWVLFTYVYSHMDRETFDTLQDEVRQEMDESDYTGQEIEVHPVPYNSRQPVKCSPEYKQQKW